MMIHEIPFLPVLTRENLRTVMQKQIATVRNDTTSIPMLWQGFHRARLDVDGQERTLLTYVPKNSPQGTMIVLMNVPEGESAQSFLEKTRWQALADEQGVVLFLAEPGPGGWGTPGEEQAYLESCFRFERADDYLRGGLCVYIVGYGPVGACLHQIAMTTPLKIAGAVFLDASDLSRETVRRLKEKAVCVPGCAYDVMLKDIPVPLWIRSAEMTPETLAVAEHWKQAIQAGEPVWDPILGDVFLQGKDSVCTPEGRIAKVAVQKKAVDYTAPETAREICSFLKQYFRYGSNGPYGNTLGMQVDYPKRGVEVRYYRDNQGLSRECLVYVPETFRGKGPLPLVFAVHGSSESCRNYFEESLLYRKAEEAGFMLVMPEGTLKEMPSAVSRGVPKAYRSLWEVEDPADVSDIEYCERILDDIIANYPVDTRRLYCTGHSMGCMMTSYIGSSSLSHRFAALAATSGPSISMRNTGTQHVPIYFTMGENDLWDYSVTVEQEMSHTLNVWLVRNGLATPENVRNVRISGADRVYDDDRHHCMVWENEAGEPMVRYDWIRGKDHMNTPDENFRFWDEWFSRWILEEDGRHYRADLNNASATADQPSAGRHSQAVHKRSS